MLKQRLARLSAGSPPAVRSQASSTASAPSGPPPHHASTSSFSSLATTRTRAHERPSTPICSSPRGSHRNWSSSRAFSDQMTFRLRNGSMKVNLKSKGTVGVAQSRGERPYQEDTFAVHSVLVPTQALKRNIVSMKGVTGWSPETLEGFAGEDPSLVDGKRQVAFFGVYDGHGGPQVSKYLQGNLHTLVEETEVGDIPKVVDKYRALGGYLRRYRGGPLNRFREPHDEHNDPLGMALDEMCVLAFLEADNAVLDDPSSGKAGSVATVALLHSLDTPFSLPFYASNLISLTIAHLGDTRAILASSSSGRAQTLTENHHPDSRIESERLRQSGTGIVTDSFGESRWGGTLANTRGIGDREFKTLGVLGEPEISKRVLKGPEWSFLVLLSDGITDSMSDQEVVDLARGFSDPTRAAANIVKFAEDVGGEDNMTAIVIPLPGWGKMGGVDMSASRREFRLRQNTGQSGRSKRM